jgi:hypothetical protein
MAAEGFRMAVRWLSGLSISFGRCSDVREIKVPADCVQVLAAIRNKCFVNDCWEGQVLEARARRLESRGVAPANSLVLWREDGSAVCNSQLMAARFDEWEWQLLIPPLAAERIRRRGPWALLQLQFSYRSSGKKCWCREGELCRGS